ncbi:MAG TPA: hypothetical protein VFW47_13760 [Phenylobacterium sp.]|nr:hypothetical protein [Phenylobacterium sp.]
MSLPPAQEPDRKAIRRARRMDLQAMSARADRLRWRVVRPPEESRLRRPLRLWLPLSPILILLSPLLLLALGIAVFLPRPLGVNPAHVVLGVGRVLLALNGTQVEVESPRASVLIKIF